jgi:hypothetical protein
MGGSAAAEGEPVLEVVLFHAGPYRCALEAARVAALEPAEGEAVAVAALLRLATPAAGRCRHLRLRRAAPPLVLSVAEPVELRSFPLSGIQPLPPLLAARETLPALRALYLDGDGAVLILDAERLG